MSKHKKFTSNVGGQEIIVETGKLAGLAGGAVTIRQGDTMLLATATMSSNARPGIDFAVTQMPLTNSPCPSSPSLKYSFRTHTSIEGRLTTNVDIC